MNEQSRIRGRWTVTIAKNGCLIWDDTAWDNFGERRVEVVLVPDEQAIERAAKALARRYGEEVGFADWLGIARTVASALEPPE